jgi:protein-S-isoprenylcysteine O-methyltransferase Ste14
MLLGRFVKTYVKMNVDRSIDGTKRTAEETVRKLNWQNIGYLFILLTVLVRVPFIAKYLSKNQLLQGKPSSVHADSKLQQIALVLLGLATFEGIYLVDKLNPIWAYITFPPNDTVSYVGVALGALAIGHLLYLHRSLGSSWAATISIQKDHALKIRGPFGNARHPMYLNFLLHPIALLLITQNWLLSLVFVPWVLYAVSRIKREERLLIDEFGQSYIDYMQKVPALGPIDKLLGRNLGLNRAEAQAVLDKRGRISEEKKEPSTGKR